MARAARLLVGALTVAAATAPGFAHGAPPATRLRVDFRLSSLYDSNVLQYSPQDQDAFLANNPASRFGIRSLDDDAFRGAASVSISRRLHGARASRLRYSFTRYAYVENPIEDSRVHAVSIQQPVGRGAWVDVGYTRLPHSYVRHLWDEDFVSPYRFYSRYQPAIFASDRLRVEAGFRPRPAWELSARVARTWQDYNAAFDERDSRTWELSSAITHGREAGISWTLAPTFARRRADATDRAHPAIPDSLRDDTSLREAGLEFDASFPKRLLLKIPVDIGARLAVVHRTFTTDRAADVFHHGRTDTDMELAFDIERDLRAGIALFAVYRYETRTSSGVETTGTRADVSEYSQSVVGGGVHVSWSGRLP